MCNAGDIILIPKYKDNGKDIDRHSFVVINTEKGQIQGLDYDIICNVMSSFKNEKQRQKKLSYLGNFPISHDDTTVKGNNKDGYIKAEQFYFFNSEKTDYMVIGKMNDDVFNLLIEFIEELDIQYEFVLDNL